MKAAIKNEIGSAAPRIPKDFPPMIVIGKIIVDSYGKPKEEDNKIGLDDDDCIAVPEKLVIGGGGPQAAWGAAAAMAELSLFDSIQEKKQPQEMPPPPQPVSLLGPVGGDDWTSAEQNALNKALDGCLINGPTLIRGPNFRTPRIQLWHDEEQRVKWMPINQSFGALGADGLWEHFPTSDDLLRIIHQCSTTTNSKKVILHSILEAGANAPGRGGDAKPFYHPDVRKQISFLGIEPIAFLDETTGQVSERDVLSAQNLLQSLLYVKTDDSLHSPPIRLIISPDNHLYEALINNDQSAIHNHYQFDLFSMEQSKNTENVPRLDSITVRMGPEGSIVMDCNNNNNNDDDDDDMGQPRMENKSNMMFSIPSATLYANGETITSPINPTGAGNAYAAAYTACRAGADLSTFDAACMASAIGAVICEYDHLPPWTWSVLQRIQEAYKEIQSLATSKLQ